MLFITPNYWLNEEYEFELLYIKYNFCTIILDSTVSALWLDARPILTTA